MRVGGLGLHVGQIDDGAVVGHEGSGQAQQGVFHPEALHARLLKDKQHALVWGHVLAPHQADLPLHGVGGHLRLDAVYAGGQDESGQIGLRGLGVGAGGEPREKHQGRRLGLAQEGFRCCHDPRV